MIPFDIQSSLGAGRPLTMLTACAASKGFTMRVSTFGKQIENNNIIVLKNTSKPESFISDNAPESQKNENIDKSEHQTLGQITKRIWGTSYNLYQEARI